MTTDGVRFGEQQERSKVRFQVVRCAVTSGSQTVTRSEEETKTKTKMKMLSFSLGWTGSEGQFLVRGLVQTL